MKQVDEMQNYKGDVDLLSRECSDRVKQLFYFTNFIVLLLLQFSNLLGTVYKKGNIVFSKNGDFLLSPVGNRVTLFDLKRCAFYFASLHLLGKGR